MTGIHHVNLPVPPDTSEPIAAFYIDVLGFHRISKPEGGRPGVWLELPTGVQLHLSERDGENHPDAHIAFLVDDFDDLRARLDKVGAEFHSAEDVFGTGGRGFTRDPGGNRIELIATP